MQKEKWAINLLFMLSVFLISIFGGVSNAFAEDPVIITNSSVPNESYSKDDVKNIFLGNKTKWSDGSEISVAITKNSKLLHETFLTKFIDRKPEQFDRNWKMIIFTGKGKPPSEFQSAQEVLEFVSKNKGAIGYIFQNEKNDSVRIITPK